MDKRRISDSLSTNAAIFASVLLASRLDTNVDVFGLLSFAVEWFSLFPIFRRHLSVIDINQHYCKDTLLTKPLFLSFVYQALSVKVQVGVTMTMLLSCIVLFSHISKAVVIIYILGFCFLTFVCPYWLIFIQKYKK